jgi:hypothetical protein
MTPEIITALSQTGALGAVAAWALWFIGTKLDKLTGAVTDLHERIGIMLDRQGQPK